MFSLTPFSSLSPHLSSPFSSPSSLSLSRSSLQQVRFSPPLHRSHHPAQSQPYLDVLVTSSFLLLVTSSDALVTSSCQLI